MKKSIVIAGANSFIARHLIKQLDTQTYYVTAVVRKIPQETLCRTDIRYLELDMEEYEKLPEYIDR